MAKHWILRDADESLLLGEAQKEDASGAGRTFTGFALENIGTIGVEGVAFPIFAGELIRFRSFIGQVVERPSGWCLRVSERRKKGTILSLPGGQTVYQELRGLVGKRVHLWQAKKTKARAKAAGKKAAKAKAQVAA